MWISVTCSAQNNLSAVPKNWHWKDIQQDSIHGISLEKAYQLLPSLHITPSPIIVAVMDGGIDTNHIALKGRLWKNKLEIEGNKIDDDQNGYVDDINGWNFLGGKDGTNIDKASDEKSRIYHRFKLIYDQANIDSSQWTLGEKKQFQIWKKAASEMEMSEEALANLQYLKMTANALQKLGALIIKEIEDTNFNAEKLENFQPLGRIALEAKMAYLRTLSIIGVDKEAGHSNNLKDLNEYITGKEKAANAKEQAPEEIRKAIIKDQYYLLSDQYYGNNDIMGPNAKHGTHVAGLVASTPDSSWKADKWYPPIQIMGLRVVPDGDEYDKDIALGIRYAVNNGAKIINMSFGKSYSPEQAWVDSAIRYAASKDVLIIHSAGNEAYDLNSKEVYPSPYSNSYNDTASNILTVGASSDPRIGEAILTDFSNYGNKIVDLLAPGDKIYSTLPGTNDYGYLRGTSMSAPIVSHIAAMLRSYYPQLSAIQIKEILLKSVWQPTEGPNNLLDICRTGGIINAALSVQNATAYSIRTNIKKNKKNKN